MQLDLNVDPRDFACQIATFLARNAADTHGIALRVHSVSRELTLARHGGYAPDTASARWREADLRRTAERYGVVLSPCDDEPTDLPDDAIFDVPSFVIDGGPPIYGVDRWPLVSRRLAPACAFVPSLRAGAVEVFHDVASPYSYLGVTALIASGADITFTPILLGALFRALGTPDVPVAAMSHARREWVGRDLRDWADFRGVPFRYTTRFPIRSVTAQRATIVDPRALAPLYAAAWAEDRPLSDPSEVAAVLDAAGLAGDEIVRRTDEAKTALRANTDRALSLGVFGVPTFRVGGELFWGQDHLEAALHHSVRSFPT